MGFSLYVCPKCTQVNCNSDLGGHVDKCKGKRIKNKKALIQRYEEKLNNYWNGDSLSEKHIAFFHTFYDAIDKLMNDTYTDENDKQHLIKLVNSFMLNNDRPKYEQHEINQSEKDEKEAVKVYGYNPVKGGGTHDREQREQIMLQMLKQMLNK